MDGQLSFATLDYAGKKKRTRRDAFLAEMAAAVPWSVLEALIAPHYPKEGPQGVCDTEWTMSIPGPRPTRRVTGREWSTICIGVPRHSALFSSPWSRKPVLPFLRNRSPASALRSWRAATSHRPLAWPVSPPPGPKISEAPPSSCAFHVVIWLGWTSNCSASWAMVRSPLTAASATFASHGEVQVKGVVSG